MKYVIEAAIKTKAFVFLVLRLVLNGVAISINAKMLIWISAALETGDIKYGNLVIFGSVANIIISAILGYIVIHRQIMFSYLHNIYTEKLVHADIELYSKYNPGTLQHVQSRINSISSMINIYVQIGVNIIMIVVYIIQIINIDISRLPSVAFVCVLQFIIMNIANKKWQKIDKEIDEVKTKKDSEFDEITNGFLEARSFPNTIEHHLKSIINLNADIMKVFSKRFILNTIIYATSDATSGALTIIAVLYYMMNPNITSSTAMAVIVFVWRLLDPISNVVFMWSDMSDMRSALPKFNEIMSYKNKIKDGSIELEEFNSSIDINDMSFSYDKSSMVLNNINIKIPKGHHIGICGPTGGGKSTLLKLIPRFYDVDAGSISIDGINIKDLKISSVRKHIGIVHQSIYIFDGTLFDNIAYAKLPNIPSEFEVIEACKKACIYDFIKSLPNGFNTEVGPRGLKLSGGQKQRIGLARLFLLDPDIIILDEATSALDNETESLVQEAINLFKDKTIITVAHRLSTIKDSDCIYVIKDHRVVESGTHDELMNKHGLYYNMQK